MKDTRSFFEKLTGAVKMEDTEHVAHTTPSIHPSLGTSHIHQKTQTSDWDSEAEEEEDGELTVDVYQSNNDIVVKCMVAGVKPEDLEITITRDMVTIRGKRETERTISDEDYFHQELYWGSFSRTVMLPAEVDVEEAEAIEKHGLLMIRLPKIDRHKQAKLKVKG